MQSRKIIFCDNSLRNLLNFRGDVISHFAKQGIEIVLVAPATCQFHSSLPNIRYTPIEMSRSGTNPFADLSYSISLFRIYRTEKPDIIFHYTIKPNIYGTFAARICGCKSVSMVAGLGYVFSGNEMGKRIGRFIYKMGLRLSHYVLLLNHFNAEKLVREGFVRKGRAVLLKGGEGVNLERFPYVQKRFDTIRFLMVARLLYDKGYSEYVKAAITVKNKYPDIEFGLLGPLDEASPMAVPESVVKKDVADGKITYFGMTNDVPSWLSRDGVIVVLVSYYPEGLNRSLMEACAKGCPCITTDIPGCRETVVDGENGFLVPVKNSQALADAMIRFIGLPVEKKRAMAEKSRQIAVEKFDISKVLDVYDEIIEDL